MCLIIYKPKYVKISRSRLEEAFQANPDGWGILSSLNSYSTEAKFWLSKQCSNFDMFFLNYLYSEPLGDLLIHFRTASSGKIAPHNNHPLFVNDNLAFMENGNFYEYSNYFRNGERKDSLTDVQRFNNEVLKKLPEGFLQNLKIKKALTNYCVNNFVKMAFMDEKGDTTLINKSSGEWVDDCWYSNGGIKNYVGYGYSGAYSYLKNDIRHKGGIPNIQVFEEDKRKTYIKCESCLGWFKEWKIIDGICESCKTWKELLKYVI